MVRVAGLFDQLDAGIDARGPDGLAPERADRRDPGPGAGARPTACTRCFDGDPAPGAGGAGDPHRHARHAPARRSGARSTRRFHEQVFPALTPLVIGLGRPFPYISNLSLSLGVLLRDPESGTEIIARVKVPKELLGRFLPLGEDGTAFVPLEEAIAANLDALFPGTEVVDHGYFRVTRDADFNVSDEADDLLQAVQDEIRRRRFGEVVRLEIAAGMNPKLREQLIDALRLEDREVYDVDGLIDLGDLGDDRRRPRPRRAALRALDAGHPAAPAGRGRRAGRHVRGDPPGRHPRPPSLRLLRHLGRALRRAGGRRPRRAGDQADRLPDQRRLAAGAVADPRLRTRQAGGLHGRAESPLRRGGQHPLGEVAGGGGRPRRLRHPRAEDPRQGDPRRPPRGRPGARVRPHRHRQLQPEDGPPLHRLRPLHRRPRDRRRRRRDVQLPHRLRPPGRVPQGAGLADDDARPASSRRSSARSPPTRPAKRRGSR